MHREWREAASCVQTGILNACREQGEMPGQQTIHDRSWTYKSSKYFNTFINMKKIDLRCFNQKVNHIPRKNSPT